MAHELTICLYNPDQQGRSDFATAFRELPGVRVHCEAATPEDLRDWLRSVHFDAVCLNLDLKNDAGFAAVETIVHAAPKTPIVGVSAMQEPTFIIRAMRSGCSQFVCWPIDNNDLRSVFERLRALRPAVVSQSKRVCVVGSSGGTGATTIACNLAMELAQESGQRVGLVDMNLEFGDVACAFDCHPSYSVADVCSDTGDVDRSVLERALHELPCNVSLLARPENIEQARAVMPDGIEHVLTVMGEMFPHVVVDLPRAYGFLSTAVLRESDAVLIVMQLGVPFIRNAARLYQNLVDMGAREERIHFVINRCNSNAERITPKEVEEHFNRPVFAMIPNDYRRVQGALDLGHSLGADAPNSPVRTAIRGMAKRIVHPDTEAAAGAAAAGPSFLGRLFGRGAKP